MNGDNEKKATSELDEGALMNLMVAGVRKEGFKITEEDKPILLSSN